MKQLYPKIKAGPVQEVIKALLAKVADGRIQVDVELLEE